MNVTCTNSTMVSPIHLLLFGARKVEYTKNLVVLDDWFVTMTMHYQKCFKIILILFYRIYLNMDVEIAAAIVALRLAIDDLIIKTTKNPKLILKPNKIDIKLINILKDLCNFNAGRNYLSAITFDNG